MVGSINPIFFRLVYSGKLWKRVFKHKYFKKMLYYVLLLKMAFRHIFRQYNLFVTRGTWYIYKNVLNALITIIPGRKFYHYRVSLFSLKYTPKTRFNIKMKKNMWPSYKQLTKISSIVQNKTYLRKLNFTKRYYKTRYKLKKNKLKPKFYRENIALLPLTLYTFLNYSFCYTKKRVRAYYAYLKNYRFFLSIKSRRQLLNKFKVDKARIQFYKIIKNNFFKYLKIKLQKDIVQKFKFFLKYLNNSTYPLFLYHNGWSNLFISLKTFLFKKYNSSVIRIFTKRYWILHRLFLLHLTSFMSKLLDFNADLHFADLGYWSLESEDFTRGWRRADGFLRFYKKKDIPIFKFLFISLYYTLKVHSLDFLLFYLNFTILRWTKRRWGPIFKYLRELLLDYRSPFSVILYQFRGFHFILRGRPSGRPRRKKVSFLLKARPAKQNPILHMQYAYKQLVSRYSVCSLKIWWYTFCYTKNIRTYKSYSELASHNPLALKFHTQRRYLRKSVAGGPSTKTLVI